MKLASLMMALPFVLCACGGEADALHLTWDDHVHDGVLDRARAQRQPDRLHLVLESVEDPIPGAADDEYVFDVWIDLAPDIAAGDHPIRADQRFTNVEPSSRTDVLPGEHRLTPREGHDSGVLDVVIFGGANCFPPPETTLAIDGTLTIDRADERLAGRFELVLVGDLLCAYPAMSTGTTSGRFDLPVDIAR